MHTDCCADLQSTEAGPGEESYIRVRLNPRKRNLLCLLRHEVVYNNNPITPNNEFVPNTFPRCVPYKWGLLILLHFSPSDQHLGRCL